MTLAGAEIGAASNQSLHLPIDCVCCMLTLANWPATMAMSQLDQPTSSRHCIAYAKVKKKPLELTKGIKELARRVCGQTGIV